MSATVYGWRRAVLFFLNRIFVRLIATMTRSIDCVFGNGLQRVAPGSCRRSNVLQVGRYILGCTIQLS